MTATRSTTLTPKQGFLWAALHSVAAVIAWIRVGTDQQIVYVILALFFTAMAIRYAVTAEQLRRRLLTEK